MSCFGEDSIKVSNMSSPLKSGYMLKYKKRLFCKDWKEHYLTLYDDSTLVWFKDRHSNEKEGGVYIKNSPDLMAFGEFTQQVPNRPDLPSGYTTATLIAFGTRGKETVHWFLCKYELEVKEWMSAIISTLPPPPQPPQYVPPPATNPSAPVIEVQQQQTNPISELPPPSTNPPIQPTYQAMPRQFPPQTMVPQYSPYPQQIGPLQPGYATQPPSNTTVVVQDRQNNTGTDFAMGMLVGGAVGYTWGHGFGWGHGGGWGGGGGGVHQNTDINIYNNYDVNQIQNTSNVQNETTNIYDNDVPDTFEPDDYGADDFDGGFDGVDF